MTKDYEDDEKVIYLFGPNELTFGKIEYDKKSKKLNVIEDVNDENISNEAYVKWAAQRIGRILYKEGGEFPDQTSVEG
ncbi:hypothetical protein ACYSNR_07745 [Enterococcus sp. LJL128]